MTSRPEHSSGISTTRIKETLAEHKVASGVAATLLLAGATLGGVNAVEQQAVATPQTPPSAAPASPSSPPEFSERQEQAVRRAEENAHLKSKLAQPTVKKVESWGNLRPAARTAPAPKKAEAPKLVAAPAPKSPKIAPKRSVTKPAVKKQTPPVEAPEGGDVEAVQLVSSSAPLLPAPGTTFGWPTSTTRVTSEYGMRLHPVLGVWKFHTGVDFGEPCGQPVFASLDGKVLGAGGAGGYGNRVVLTHRDNISTTYSHLSALSVKPGQQVKRGQVVGLIGSTGYSTGCHLHFEVLQGMNFTQPMNWLMGKATGVQTLVPTKSLALGGTLWSPPARPKTTASPRPKVSPRPEQTVKPSPKPTQSTATPRPTESRETPKTTPTTTPSASPQTTAPPQPHATTRQPTPKTTNSSPAARSSATATKSAVATSSSVAVKPSKASSQSASGGAPSGSAPAATATGGNK